MISKKASCIITILLFLFVFEVYADPPCWALRDSYEEARARQATFEGYVKTINKAIGRLNGHQLKDLYRD